MKKNKLKNKNGNLCKYLCGSVSAPNRKECFKCRSARIRATKRPQMVFYWIKQSAKRRGLQFELEMNWFLNFIKENNYIANSGRLSDHLTIDRKDGSKGYTHENIRVVTKGENVSKFHKKELEYPNGTSF